MFAIIFLITGLSFWNPSTTRGKFLEFDKTNRDVLIYSDPVNLFSPFRKIDFHFSNKFE